MFQNQGATLSEMIGNDKRSKKPPHAPYCKLAYTIPYYYYYTAEHLDLSVIHARILHLPSLQLRHFYVLCAVVEHEQMHVRPYCQTRINSRCNACFPVLSEALHHRVINLQVK